MEPIKEFDQMLGQIQESCKFEKEKLESVLMNQQKKPKKKGKKAGADTSI
jgi:hypothetical protein